MEISTATTLPRALQAQLVPSNGDALVQQIQARNVEALIVAVRSAPPGATQKGAGSYVIDLDIEGERIEVSSKHAFDAGTRVLVRAVTPLRIRIEQVLDDSARRAQSVAKTVLRQALPQQIPLRDSLQQVQKFLHDQTLPLPVRERMRQLLEALPEPGQLQHASGVRRAVLQSGVFLEGRLRAMPAPHATNRSSHTVAAVAPPRPSPQAPPAIANSLPAAPPGNLTIETLPRIGAPVPGLEARLANSLAPSAATAATTTDFSIHVPPTPAPQPNSAAKAPQPVHDKSPLPAATAITLPAAKINTITSNTAGMPTYPTADEASAALLKTPEAQPGTSRAPSATFAPESAARHPVSPVAADPVTTMISPQALIRFYPATASDPATPVAPVPTHGERKQIPAEVQAPTPAGTNPSAFLRAVEGVLTLLRVTLPSSGPTPQTAVTVAADGSVSATANATATYDSSGRLPDFKAPGLASLLTVRPAANAESVRNSASLAHAPTNGPRQPPPNFAPAVAGPGGAVVPATVAAPAATSHPAAAAFVGSGSAIVMPAPAGVAATALTEEVPSTPGPANAGAVSQASRVAPPSGSAAALATAIGGAPDVPAGSPIQASQHDAQRGARSATAIADTTRTGSPAPEATAAPRSTPAAVIGAAMPAISPVASVTATITGTATPTTSTASPGNPLVPASELSIMAPKIDATAAPAHHGNATAAAQSSPVLADARPSSVPITRTPADTRPNDRGTASASSSVAADRTTAGPADKPRSRVATTMPEQALLNAQPGGARTGNSLDTSRVQAISLLDDSTYLERDVKAKLLGLLEVLQNFFPRARGGAASTANVPTRDSGNAMAQQAPLYTARGTSSANPGDEPFRPQRAAPGLHSEASVQKAPQHAGETLIRHVEGALARTHVHQLSTLPDARYSGDGGPAATWSIEIPIRNGRALDLLELDIEDHGPTVGAASGTAHRWQIMMRVDIASLGPLHALLQLTGSRLSTTLWAERPNTLSCMRLALDTLAVALQAEGVDVVRLECMPGRPPPERSRQLVSLLDVRT